MRASNVRPFIPVQPQPAQIVEDLLCSRRRIALKIGIFNAQQKTTAHPTGQQPIEQGRTCPANVKIAGRGRCKSGYNHSLILVVELQKIKSLPRRHCKVNNKKYKKQKTQSLF
jgi:hypothetical protein